MPILLLLIINQHCLAKILHLSRRLCIGTLGESCIMSAGSTASAPYTRKNGVYPVDLFGVVLRLHSTAGSSSIQHPADLCSGLTSRGFIPDNTSPLDLSTCPLDVG